MGDVAVRGTVAATAVAFVAVLGACDDEHCGADVAGEDGDVTVVSLSAGAYHTCALLSNGAVRCWGYGAAGHLGRASFEDIGDDETPADGGDVLLGGKASQVSAGGLHTCAVLDTGAVRCWGSAAHGRLGYPDCVTDALYNLGCNIGDDEAPACAGDVDVGGEVIQVEAGNFPLRDSTCALLGSGDVRCWGHGANGKLGSGTCMVEDMDDASCHVGDDEEPASAATLELGGTAVQLSLGGYTLDPHACAVLTDGRVRCWGPWFALGYGSQEDVGDDETPASMGDVEVGGDVAQVATGAQHTCALLVDGRVRCWGFSDHGELGYGDRQAVGTRPEILPLTAGDVEVGGTVVQLTAGRYHTCALLEAGAIRCWGWGPNGQLGYGDPDRLAVGGDGDVPADAGDVPVGGPAVQVVAGMHHTCALLADGTVRCWGEAQRGRLGYGDCIPVNGLDTACNIGDDETPAEAGTVEVLRR